MAIETINSHSDILFMVCGLIGFVFRLWICEKKLKHLLQFRSLYLSRILAYFYFIAMIFAWRSIILNVIVVVGMPLMAFSIFLLDVPFFWQFREAKNRIPGYNGWILLERFTLHIPTTITAVIWLTTRFVLDYTPFTRLTVFLLCFFIVILPFFLFDVRWAKRFESPRGVFVLLGILGSGLRIYWYFVTIA